MCPSAAPPREVLTLRNTSTPDEIEILRARPARCARVCLDYTGGGIGLGDYLARQFGACTEIDAVSGRFSGGKVELCQFTTNLKSELFPRLRAAFENRTLRIPPSREIREDLHGIQQIVGNSGQLTFRALSSTDGHSDRCTALALALRAAGATPAFTGGGGVVDTRRREYRRLDNPYLPTRIYNIY